MEEVYNFIETIPMIKKNKQKLLRELHHIENNFTNVESTVSYTYGGANVNCTINKTKSIGFFISDSGSWVKSIGYKNP